MKYIEQAKVEVDKNSFKKYIFNILKDMIHNGYTIEQIEDMSQQLTSYIIISYLIEFGNNDEVILQAINNYFSSLKIDSNRCLIIADTHIGKILDFENPDDYINPNVIFHNELGLYNAYNYALKNGISSIIHLGDLIDGDPVHKSVISPKHQVEYLERIYPTIDGIETFLLYGNHDYNAIRFDDITDNFAKSCHNLKIIGVNYSLVYFGKYPIKLSHKKSVCKNIKHVHLPYDFELAGHRHIFNIDENARYVNAPALALSLQDNSMIGFLELTNEEHEFVFKYLDQEANQKDEKVLAKKREIK